MAASARSGFALGLCTGLVLASALFMLREYVPAPAGRQAATDDAATPSAPASVGSPMAAPESTGQAGSMQSSVVALCSRLAAQGGPDDQWELLAKSYEFMGRPADAKLAREHKVPANRDLGDAVTASAMLLPSWNAASSRATQGATSRANNNTSLLASAEQHRRNREFKQACAAYAAAASAGPMTADAWADYADAQASLSGHLVGAPEKLIASALAQDPRHPKALWLKASLAHEQHRYEEALATWKQLLALVPPGSSDARIVQANIDEASRLARG
jgi:cytochrome c-type biogenesis protein CcmH/NrfG